MLAAEPGSVGVVDIFSRTAAWRFPKTWQDIERIQAIRREEELLMSRLTGAWVQGLDLPEALLRGHTMEQAFSVQPGESETAAAQTITKSLIDLACQHPKAQWYLPLGVGHHIDHRVTRDAALAALGQARVADAQIHLYEELPYAAKLDWLAQLPSMTPGRKLRPINLAMNEHARWKLELLRLYWSQLAWPQIVEVGRYARRIGGGREVERVWELTAGKTN